MSDVATEHWAERDELVARGYQKAIDALRAEGAKALERFAEAHRDSPEWDMYDSAADYLEFLRGVD